MENKAIDTAIEIAKVAPPEMTLKALIIVSMAVTIVCATILLIKYVKPKFDKKSDCDKCADRIIAKSAVTAIEVNNDFMQELKYDNKVLTNKVDKLEVNQVEHSKLLEKISTHMEVQTQLLMTKL